MVETEKQFSRNPDYNNFTIMNETDFSRLPLACEMLRNLGELGFTTMTPVQAESLPHILEGRDVIAKARTGSGKTAAFGIGLVSRLEVTRFRVQSLVLCPTRELADQVANELRRLARATPNVKILTLCGGAAFGPQYGSLLHGAHIVVGTPGRVLKHLDKGNLSLQALDTLVLDEADRMLDMGFIEEIERVIAHAPARRQTLLFSATFPERIVQLSTTVQIDAIFIQAPAAEEDLQISEYFYTAGEEDKTSLLVRIIAHHNPGNVLVFCNTKLETREVADNLCQAGIEALAIHGDLEQFERTDVLVRFANRSSAVLAATDVAARGLDIEDLEMVVNYDVPQNEATYIHRIGRTGRAGKKGLAATIIAASNVRVMDQYRNETRQFFDADALREVENFSLTPANGTLVVEAGKKDKIRPGDLLGALTGKAGIAAKYVGKIDVHDRQSYVAIDRTVIDRAYLHLKNGRIKGRSYPVWVFGRTVPNDAGNVWQTSRHYQKQKQDR